MFTMNNLKSSSPNVQKLFPRAKATTISWNVFISILIISQVCFTVPTGATEKCGGVKSRYVCDDKDPSVFHICLGNNHFTMVCPGMLHFNWRTQTCDWPSETDCVREIANNPRPPPKPAQTRPRQSYSPPAQRAPPKPQSRPVSPPRSVPKVVTQSPRTNPPRARNSFPQPNRNIQKPRQPAPKIRGPVTPRLPPPSARTPQNRKPVTPPQDKTNPPVADKVDDESSDTITDDDVPDDFDATMDHDVIPKLKVISRDPEIFDDEEFDSSALEELGIGHLIVPFKANVPGRDPSLANQVSRVKAPPMHRFRKTTPRSETPVTWYEKYEKEHGSTARKRYRGRGKTASTRASRFTTAWPSSPTWYDKSKETPPPHSVYRSGSTTRHHDPSEEPSDIEFRTMPESEVRSNSRHQSYRPSPVLTLSTKIPSWTTTKSATVYQSRDETTKHQVSSDTRSFKSMNLPSTSNDFQTTVVRRTSPVKSSSPFSSDTTQRSSSPYADGKHYISSSPFRPPAPKEIMYWPTTRKQGSHKSRESSVSQNEDSSNQNDETVNEDKISTHPQSNQVSEKPTVKLSPYRPQEQMFPSKPKVSRFTPKKPVSLSPFAPPSSVEFRPSPKRYNSRTSTRPRASTYVKTAGDMRDDLKTSAVWYETSPTPTTKEKKSNRNRSKRPMQRPESPYTPPPYLASTHYRKTTQPKPKSRTTATKFDTRQKPSTFAAREELSSEQNTKSQTEPWYTRTNELLKETRRNTQKSHTHTHKHESTSTRESKGTTKPSVSAAASTRRETTRYETTRPATRKSKTTPWWSSVQPTTKKSSLSRYFDKKRNSFPKRYGIPKPNYHTRTPAESFNLLPSERRPSSYMSSLREDSKSHQHQPINAAASTDKRFSLHKSVKSPAKERTFSLHKSNKSPTDSKFALHKPENNRPINAPAASDEKFVLHTPEQEAKTKIDTYKSPIFNYKVKKGKCSDKWCKLPNCRCIGNDIPGDLDAKDIPQMVMLTFDDSINFQNMKYYKDIFNGSLKNPNGCPIKSTFFVSGDNSDFGMVRTIYKGGHEIASHTLSHRNPTTWWAYAGYDNWENEVVGMKQRLHEKAGVPLENIKGMRAPFLQVGGDAQFAMLKENKFRYDSSMVTGNLYNNNNRPIWPFTLDTAPDSQTCSLTPCPTRSYPGLWEVPLIRWYGSNDMACGMPDACTIGTGASGAKAFVDKNFKRHYMTNRAPLGIFIHASWFGRQRGNFEGLLQFLQSLKGRDDVWVVTVDQALDWIQRPVRLSAIDSIKSWRC